MPLKIDLSQYCALVHGQVYLRNRSWVKGVIKAETSDVTVGANPFDPVNKYLSPAVHEQELDSSTRSTTALLSM